MDDWSATCHCMSTCTRFAYKYYREDFQQVLYSEYWHSNQVLPCAVLYVLVVVGLRRYNCTRSGVSDLVRDMTYSFCMTVRSRRTRVHFSCKYQYKVVQYIQVPSLVFDKYSVTQSTLQSTVGAIHMYSEYSIVDHSIYRFMHLKESQYVNVVR